MAVVMTSLAQIRNQNQSPNTRKILDLEGKVKSKRYKFLICLDKKNMKIQAWVAAAFSGAIWLFPATCGQLILDTHGWRTFLKYASQIVSNYVCQIAWNPASQIASNPAGQIASTCWQDSLNTCRPNSLKSCRPNILKTSQPNSLKSCQPNSLKSWQPNSFKSC